MKTIRKRVDWEKYKPVEGKPNIITLAGKMSVVLDNYDWDITLKDNSSVIVGGNATGSFTAQDCSNITVEHVELPRENRITVTLNDSAGFSGYDSNVTVADFSRAVAENNCLIENDGSYGLVILHGESKMIGNSNGRIELDDLSEAKMHTLRGVVHATGYSSLAVDSASIVFADENATVESYGESLIVASESANVTGTMDTVIVADDRKTSYVKTFGKGTVLNLKPYNMYGLDDPGREFERRGVTETSEGYVVYTQFFDVGNGPEMSAAFSHDGMEPIKNVIGRYVSDFMVTPYRYAALDGAGGKVVKLTLQKGSIVRYNGGFAGVLSSYEVMDVRHI